MSALEVSFCSTTTRVAGSAMPTTIRKGTIVQAISTAVLSWKSAALAPRDFRWAQTE